MDKNKTKIKQFDGSLFPSADVLNRLAISENGFIFDPASGNSFTVNQTGLLIIDLLKKEPDHKKALASIQHQFNVSSTTLERDVLEFARTLREWLGIP